MIIKKKRRTLHPRPSLRCKNKNNNLSSAFILLKFVNTSIKSLIDLKGERYLIRIETNKKKALEN